VDTHAELVPIAAAAGFAISVDGSGLGPQPVAGTGAQKPAEAQIVISGDRPRH
jgi:hypothetical protein